MAAADTRRAVLDAALAEFERVGFASATVSDIAAAAQVSVNTVYLNVGGKPQLLISLIETAVADKRIELGMDKVLGAESVPELVRELASGTGTMFETNEWLIGSLYDNAHADPLIADTAAAADAIYMGNLGAAAGRVLELDDSPTGLSAEQVTHVLWFYFGFRAWRELRSLRLEFDAAMEWLIDKAQYALTD